MDSEMYQQVTLIPLKGQEIPILLFERNKDGTEKETPPFFNTLNPKGRETEEGYVPWDCWVPVLSEEEKEESRSFGDEAAFGTNMLVKDKSGTWYSVYVYKENVEMRNTFRPGSDIKVYILEGEVPELW